MKIVSGGQTGVDTVALEFAVEHGFAHGGWVPKGRTNEDGRISLRFTGMEETASTDVSVRTKLNIQDSDATLIFVDGSISPGTQLTIDHAAKLDRPYLVVDAREEISQNAQRIRDWFDPKEMVVLNIAGPRASEAPELPAVVRQILEKSLARPNVP